MLPVSIRHGPKVDEDFQERRWWTAVRLSQAWRWEGPGKSNACPSSKVYTLEITASVGAYRFGFLNRIMPENTAPWILITRVRLISIITNVIVCVCKSRHQCSIEYNSPRDEDREGGIVLRMSSSLISPALAWIRVLLRSGAATIRISARERVILRRWLSSI